MFIIKANSVETWHYIFDLRYIILVLQSFNQIALENEFDTWGCLSLVLTQVRFRSFSRVQRARAWR